MLTVSEFIISALEISGLSQSKLLLVKPFHKIYKNLYSIVILGLANDVDSLLVSKLLSFLVGNIT